MSAYLVALVAGVAMGALIYAARASEPAQIARMLRLEDLSVLKFMLTTIAVGTVLVYALSLATPVHFAIKPAYLVGVLVGGGIFGVGFALGGYCPGTCVVGAGAGRRDALFAVLGGLVGALVFTLVYRPLVVPLMRPLQLGKVTLASLLHAPGWLVAFALAVVLGAAIVGLPTVRGARRGGSPT